MTRSIAFGGLVLTTGLTLLQPGPAHAKEIIPTPPSVPVLGTAEPYLIEALQTNGGPEESWGSIAARPESQQLVEAVGIKLFSGPMVGQVTPDGASFWVRTLGESEVRVLVGIGPELSSPVTSPMVRSASTQDLVAVVRVEGLTPFTEYHYDVEVDGVRVFGETPPRFQTFPTPGQRVQFDVAWGACSRVVPDNEFIWRTMAKRKPLATLFLGDNLYIDQEGSYNIHNLYYYRRQLRQEYRELTANSAIYAIWDDHDFGINDSLGGPETFLPAWKPKVWEIFRRNWVNPSYGGGPEQPGVWFKFSMGEVDFFMTDGRYYRTASNAEAPSMLGPVQKQWLLSELKQSTALFKVLVSGTLWTEHADKGGADSWWGYRAEREEIFDLIEQEQIGGVFLLSGDRHRTEIFKMERSVGYDLFEFQTAKVTNIHTHPANGNALYFHNEGNFFGNLRFDLQEESPSVTFELINSDGTKLHEHRLARADLGPQAMRPPEPAPAPTASPTAAPMPSSSASPVPPTTATPVPSTSATPVPSDPAGPEATPDASAPESAETPSAADPQGASEETAEPSTETPSIASEPAVGDSNCDCIIAKPARHSSITWTVAALAVALTARRRLWGSDLTRG